MPIVCISPFMFLSALHAHIGNHIKANKLSTVKKCLNEVLKYGGPWNPRDLYPVRPLPLASTLFLFIIGTVC